MDISNLTPITDKILQERVTASGGDMLQYDPFYRTASTFNELLLESRIGDMLDILPS